MRDLIQTTGIDVYKRQAQTSLEMLKEMDEAAASAASPEEDKSDSK